VGPRSVCGEMNELRVELEVQEGGFRLDRFLADHVPDLSRSAAQGLIDDGQITVNGGPAKASYKVRQGDAVVVCRPAAHVTDPVAEAIPLHIVYEDAWLLVVDKAAGMVVHPAPGHTGGTLVNAVLAHCPGLAASGDDRPGIVHRLDRDTSGLIVVAKTEEVRRALQQQFKDHQVRKVYQALLEGHLQPERGRIEAPLGRDPHHRQRIAVIPSGREAITAYRVLEYLSRSSRDAGEYTLVEAEPETGRTHQIRVHLASIGHPVVRDAAYGRRRTSLPLARQFLHACRLELQHPLTGQRLEFEASLPSDLRAVLELLRNG